MRVCAGWVWLEKYIVYIGRLDTFQAVKNSNVNGYDQASWP